MSVQNINKSIKVIDNEIVQITKKFAENNLSKTCLKLADCKTDTHYEWTMEAGAYMVMFELPSIFKVDFMNISNMLSFYCPEYIEEKNLNPNNLIDIFKNNYGKKIVMSNKK